MLMVGCAAESDRDGFSELAFLRDGEVRRTGNATGPVSAVFTDVDRSTGRPVDLAWVRNGTLLSLYSDVSVARVDERPLARLGTFDCNLWVSDPTFRVEGDLLVTTASGVSPSGTGETQRCSFVLEPVSPQADRTWSFPGRTVNTNGRGVAVSCGAPIEGQRRVEVIEISSGELLTERRLGDCPLLQPGGDMVAFRDAGRLMVGPASEVDEQTWLVTGHGSSHAWSPDGRSLLVTREGGETWAVLDASTGGVLGTVSGEQAHWASASNAIVVTAQCAPGETRFTVHAHEPELPERWSTPCGAWRGGVLSPGGDTLVVTEWMDGASELVVVHRSGRTWFLGEGSSPVWRPD